MDVRPKKVRPARQQALWRRFWTYLGLVKQASFLESHTLQGQANEITDGRADLEKVPRLRKSHARRHIRSTEGVHAGVQKEYMQETGT